MLFACKLKIYFRNLVELAGMLRGLIMIVHSPNSQPRGGRGGTTARGGGHLVAFIHH